jgi:DNA polymerase IV
LASLHALEEIVSQLLTAVFPTGKGIRLLGVTLSSLERATARPNTQLTFF